MEKYKSEIEKELSIETFDINLKDDLPKINCEKPEVFLLYIPETINSIKTKDLKEIESFLLKIPEESTLLILGGIEFLNFIHNNVINCNFRYQLLLSISKNKIIDKNTKIDSSQNFAIIYTKYQKSLKHTITRLEYTYCPACNKTTKDYGGKKHTYHEYGTLISDIWKDRSYDLPTQLNELLDRIKDLFSVNPYSYLICLKMNFLEDIKSDYLINQVKYSRKINEIPSGILNNIINGDCLDQIQSFPDNSIDFIFTDPPYNLKKKYTGYNDDLEIQDYFTWCDLWLNELMRVLKPGRSLTLLNIPLWSIRHYSFLKTISNFQNWITWDALSFPVRKIMPANYTILSFSKGASRILPCFDERNAKNSNLNQLDSNLCLRKSCISKRSNIYRTEFISDVWSDIHRLKHNSKRVDHPTQLPPKLIERLLDIYTYENEIVLDCFNGSGTTTLVAALKKRKFIGIEKSKEYVELSKIRHQEIISGIDPFRKEEKVLQSKNSPVERVKKQKYLVSKKTLQLEIRRIAKIMNKIPSKEDVFNHSQYPLSMYEDYFSSWGEACAAARNKGMHEYNTQNTPNLFN